MARGECEVEVVTERQQQIIDAILASDVGLTANDLVHRLQMDDPIVREELALLEDDGFLFRDAEVSTHSERSIWLADIAELKRLNRHHVSKKRACMTCRRSFTSSHTWNRICDSCARSEMFECAA